MTKRAFIFATLPPLVLAGIAYMGWQQTGTLQKRIDNAQAIITAQVKLAIPAGSVRFDTLAPALKSQLETKQPGTSPDALNVADQTPAGPGSTSVTITKPAIITQSITSKPGLSVTETATWAALQNFAAGINLGGSGINSANGPGLTVSGGTLGNMLGSAIGTGNIANGAVTPAKLSGAGCSNNQILEYASSAWSCANPATTGTIQSLGGLTTAAQSFVLAANGANIALTSSGFVHTLSLPTASGSARGLLSDTDWALFNSKQSALAPGNVSSNTPDLTITNGTGATASPNVSLAVTAAGPSSAGLLTATDWNSFKNKQDIISFGTGLTSTGGTVTNDLATGKASGQTLTGGTTSGNNLTLSSTSHTTKGKIIFGTSNYDEATNTLNLATTSSAGLLLNVSSTSMNLSSTGLTALSWVPTSSATTTGDLLSINAGSNATVGNLLSIKNNGTPIFSIGQTAITFGATQTFTQNISLQSAIHQPTSSISAPMYAATLTDNEAVLINKGNGAPVQFYFPPASTKTGYRYTFKNQGDDTLYLTGNEFWPVPDLNSFQILPGESATAISDGTTWDVFGRYTYVPPFGDTGVQSN